MKILDLIHDYWTQIVFFIGLVITIYKMFKQNAEATKCSLRNDILEIYQECKDKKEITLYQKQALEMSYELYKRLKGNSFVDAIHDEVKTFKILN